MTRMRRGWRAAALALVGALAAAPAAAAGDSSVTITTEDDESLSGCGQVRVRFGLPGEGLATSRAEQRLTFARSDAPRLRIALRAVSGLRVQEWGQEAWEVTVCKAAGAARPATAEEILETISVRREAGSLLVEGPEERMWLVHLIVRAPAGAEMDLRTEDGGIALRGLTGLVRARTGNGPLDLRGCAGDVTAEAENGPIRAAGGSGRLLLRTENGPIDVELEPGRWRGHGLAARTENGPLSLKLPPDGGPAVCVETSGHSPFACRAPQCEGARRAWRDDERRIEIGDGPIAVILSTRNGPVTIAARTGGIDI